MSKRCLLALTAGFLCLAVCGCGQNAAAPAAGQEQETSAQEDEDQAPDAEEAAAPKEEEAMTADRLMEQMETASENAESTYVDMEAALNASFQMSAGEESASVDMSFDISTNLNMEVWAQEDPLALCMDGNLQMNIMGQAADSDLQIYVTEEDGVVKQYAYAGMTGEWQYTELSESPEEYLRQVSDPVFDSSLLSDAKLEEGTQELYNRTVYVLKAVCKGEDIEKLLGGSASMLPAESGMDMSDLPVGGITVPVTYFVDEESFLPVQIELNIEGMEDAADRMIDEELEGAGEEALQDEDVDLGFEKFEYTIKMKNISYEPQDVPPVPDEAKEAAAQYTAV